jgi:hypothetical protein
MHLQNYENAFSKMQNPFEKMQNPFHEKMQN